MSLFGGTASTGTPTSASLKRSTTLPLPTDTQSEKRPFSLFGSTPTTTQTATPSLFPPASTQPMQTAGLFGGTAQPAKPGGLFGGMATAQPQQATAAAPSLFGSTTAAPAQTTGLFGGGGLKPANTTGFGGSLFASAQAAPQPAAAPQLFTSLGPQATQSVLASTQNAPSQSAYFDQMLERGKKRNILENGGFGELPSLHLGLADIARKARNLGTGGPSAAEARAGDPRAHYLLAASGVSTASALRDLNNFSAQAGANVSQGIDQSDTDLDSFVYNLRTQSTMEMIEQGLEQSKRDFDNFLEENVQMNWEAQRQKIYEHFGLKTAGDNSSLGASGSGQARGAFGASLRQSRNTAAGASGMSFGASGMKKSILGNTHMRSTLRGSTNTNGDQSLPAPPQVAVEDRANRERMEKYAVTIAEFNQARNQNQSFPIGHQLMEVERQANESNAEALVNSYKALIAMVEEQSVTLPQSDSRVKSRERQFVKNYLVEDPRDVQALMLRTRIINGSRKCLENSFYDRLTSTIEKDPKTANLGGIPSPINKIRAYIRVMFQRKNLVIVSEDKEASVDLLQQVTLGQETDFVWCLIFYLLRCGLVAEAAKYVVENQRALRSLDRNFAKYMEAYASNPDRKLSNEIRTDLLQHYRGKTTVAPDSQIDPYMLACYKVIGRCDLSRKTLDNIPMNEEDWIWLQFALARESGKNADAQGETFGLEELRETVKDIEQRHFSQGQDASANYGVFFFLQVLAGMFEQAVALLYNQNHVAAVHFSIALSYYGLLRVANISTGDLVTYNSRQQPMVQFALLVGYYTGSFRAAKPEAAADYLTLLALNADAPGDAGKQQSTICLEALRELVLETREFALLLGDIRNDGQRVPGAIQLRTNLIRKALPKDQETDVNSFINKLTIQAANSADENGRTTDAVLLYHLAGEFDTVLNIINRTLSEALTVELGRDALKLQPLKPREQGQAASQSTLSLTSVEDPVVLAQNMYALYTGSKQAAYAKIKPATREATELLIRMALAKQELLARNFNNCANLINKINLLPMDARGDITVVRQYAQNFNQLIPLLARCVGDLLIWAVLASNGERDRLLTEGWETDNRRQVVQEWGTVIADLSIFAGLVRYKLRQGVFEVLASAGER